MRKTLTTVTTLAAGLALPMLSTGTAYADTSLEIPPAAVIVEDLVDVTIPDGCTLTYVGKVSKQPIGPVTSTGPGSVTINYGAAVTYVYAQATHTLVYVSCI